jgi:phosphate transport system substrate-binding protein
MKKLVTVLTVMIFCLGLTACGGDDTTEAIDPGATSAVSGKVTLNGSTSMEKLVNGLAEVILEDYPDLVLESQFTGSGAGIEAVSAGTTDIGNSSRSLTEEEKEEGLVENIVAIDGIVVITSTDNTTSSLTKEQLSKIYTGEIRNWNEVGGKDQPIVVLGREAGSGTRGAFEELLDVIEICEYAQEINETGAIVAKVASIPGAIGYVSLDVVDDTVKPLMIDGVEPTVKNIKGGTYALQRPFIMATKGEISEQSEQIQAVFNFIKSEKGRKLVSDVGLITVD